MENDRTCLMCGTKYQYCPHCKEYDSTETWKFLFHDKKCLAISEIWYAYRGKEISKEEAKERMSQYPESLEMIFKNTSIAAKEIRDIFGIQEEKTEEKVEEKLNEESKNDVVDVEAASIVEEQEVMEEQPKSTKKSSIVSEQAKQSFKNFNGKNNKK